MAALLAETRGGRIASDAATVEAALLVWLGTWRIDRRVPSGSDPDAIARYERRRLTGEFARVLDGVTAPRGDHIETGLD